MSFQAYCHWCYSEIFAKSISKVNSFWNQRWIGYPICLVCSKGLKTNGKPKKSFREHIGLKPLVNIKMGLDEWL